MISVVIPAYNAASCLQRAVDSVLDQTYKDYEIIVVNDGSTDRTAEVGKAYGDRIVYLAQENAGVSVARNQGAKHAKGEWIAFLDADDEFLPEKLAWQHRLLTQNPHLNWCAGNYYSSDGKQATLRVNKQRINGCLGELDFFGDYFRAATTIGLYIVWTSTVLVKRDVFLECGGFEPGRVHAEDVDLFWKIALRHPQIGYSVEPLSTYHLDIYDPSLDKRRKEAKHGKSEREIVFKHMRLSQEAGRFNAFKPCASKMMKNRLLVMLFHGYANDADQTLSQFPELFPRYWKVAGKLATRFPKATSATMHGLAYINRLLGLERNPGRRWLHKKKKYGETS